MICQLRILVWAIAVFFPVCHVAQAAPVKLPLPSSTGIVAPKVMIVSMFAPEADVWYNNFTQSGLGDLRSVNITTPGLSMQYPYVHCNGNQTVCQITTGMAEINAASTIMALTLSPKFDFRSTYWVLAGIGGINPKLATLGSVVLSRFAVQVALQYEFDAREMPSNFTTGYFSFGSTGPGRYPTNIYGTEVMELNEGLRDAAYNFALKASLNDTDSADFYRAKYRPKAGVYRAALGKPSIVKCDTATSDVYYSGAYLSEAFENVTTLWTNGTGEYCMTAQEDNATLEVLLRMAIEGRVDYSRVILLRTGSDFDRPPPDMSLYEHLLIHNQNGFVPAINNIYLAGIEIVNGILGNWDCTFSKGISPGNYIGDIFGSLGGKPDFGPGSITGGAPVKSGGSTGDLTERHIMGECT